jgi:6-phosphogluconolactonase (cycloisomerase 2 family)
MLKKATALWLAVLSAATWTGCTSTTSHYVYTTLPGSNQIVVYREDPNSGTLTTLLNSPFTTGNAPEAVVLHPSGNYLYVANSADDNISLFSIAPSTGILTEVGPRTPTGGLTPQFMAMDKANSLLYVANIIGLGSLSVFSAASDGTLTAITGSPFTINVDATGMALAPSGNFLFLGSGLGGLGQIWAFSLSGGVPSAVGQFQTSVNTIPFWLVVDSTGSFLYNANGNGGNSISEFSIDSKTGALTNLPNSPVGESGVSAPVALLIDPSGKYLYVANQGSSTSSAGNLAAYSIGSDGGLTILALSPFGTVKQPTSLAADPNGKYVMVGGQSGSLEVFLLNTSNGTLGEVATYSPGGFPSSIAVLQ